MDREHLYDLIGRIPLWKRWLICQVLRRRAWQVARAYNIVAVHAINVLGDHQLYEDMKRRGDRQWIAVYRR